MVQFDFVGLAEGIFQVLIYIGIFAGLYILINIFITMVKKLLLKKARTKKQKSNIGILTRLMKYIMILFVLLLAIFSKSGSLENAGVWLGLFSAGLGLALQRPITGMAAWIMIIIRRPFEIGDRVIIGTVKGEVLDLSLTHIYLKEIGGLASSEDNSGRIVIIPNSVLFEQNIINYTLTDEFVINEVITTITYESDLDEAIKIIYQVTEKELGEYIINSGKKPYIRTFFQASGINIHVRYFSPVEKLQETSSNITRLIFYAIRKNKKIEIAYPHTEVIFRKKK
ncbi:MAG: mechanosensitive ion channel family protein [Nanoarchaeota archaeon]